MGEQEPPPPASKGRSSSCCQKNGQCTKKKLDEKEGQVKEASTSTPGRIIRNDDIHEEKEEKVRVHPPDDEHDDQHAAAAAEKRAMVASGTTAGQDEMAATRMMKDDDDKKNRSRPPCCKGEEKNKNKNEDGHPQPPPPLEGHHKERLAGSDDATKRSCCGGGKCDAATTTTIKKQDVVHPPAACDVMASTGTTTTTTSSSPPSCCNGKNPTPSSSAPLSSCHARINKQKNEERQPLQPHLDPPFVVAGGGAASSSSSDCCRRRRVTTNNKKNDAVVDDESNNYSDNDQKKKKHNDYQQHQQHITTKTTTTTATTTMIRCIGVVHEEATSQFPVHDNDDDNTKNNNNHIVAAEKSSSSSTMLTVFDADGVAKRYRCAVDLRDLCFDDHHGTVYGELLTPCLDQNSGRHKPATSRGGDNDQSVAGGAASMDCFCGEDVPHWHAHLKAMCEREDCLAMATLYEIPEIDDDHHHHRDKDDIKTCSDRDSFHHSHHPIDISHFMPICCEKDSMSPTTTTHRSHHGTTAAEPELLIEDQHVVRVFPKAVQHGDRHVDDLILDESTGELFLRNYNCQQFSSSSSEWPSSSSSPDWTVFCRHGRFEPVASRILPFGQFSIYAVPNKPVVCHEGKEQQQQSVIVRSTIYCGGICCAAELPAVREALEGFWGVDGFHVNVPLKQVNIDHDPDRISAQALLLRLSSVGGTTVLKDGGLTECLETAKVQSKFTLTDGMTNLHHRDLEYQCPLVESFAFDQDSKTLMATHGPLTITASQIARQIGATVMHDGTKDLFPKQTNPSSEQASRQRCPRPTVIVSGVLWIVSMLSLIGGPWSHLQWVALVSILFGIPPIAMRACRAMQRWRFDTNCLMFFASIGAIGLRDFTEAAAVVFLFALSEWLELRATSRARTALLSIIQLRPDVAVVVVKEDLVTVPAAIVPVGTLVSVKAGDKIPCDGIVEVGISAVDESSLTGEARPVSKMPGSSVSGGTLNCGVSPMLIRTTATADNSAVSRLIRLVEEAQGNRSTTEMGVDRFASIYTPIVVLGALCMCTIPWFFGVGREWTRNGLVLLVVACPCALIISTPVAYVAGLAATAARGLLIKGGAHLETMAAVKLVCFDKTGTLTDGKFALLELEVLVNSLTRKQIFEFLVTMEEKASHPVAQAIVMAAKNEGIVKNEELLLTDHKILNGEGVEGNVNGQKVYIGNDRLFQRFGWNVPTKKASSGYMSIEGYGVVCSFTAADSVRPEAAEVIASLKRLGVESMVLTGDNEAAALLVADMVGLPSNKVKSRLLPEDKYRLVQGMVEDPANRSCCRGGRIMMIGDGVNDAPALAIADVGVAMGEGAALSMETADITLLDSDLRKIEYGIRMGRRVSHKIAQNILFSIASKAVVLVFALLGKAELWAAIAADVGAMLVVTLNAMMLLPNRIGLDGQRKHPTASPHGTDGTNA